MIIKILTDSDVNVNMFHSSKNKKIDCTATSLTRKRRGKREQHPPICYAFRGCFNCLELSSVMYLDVSRVKHVISNTSACSSCNVSTFDWYPLFLVRIWSFIHFNDKTRLKHHWTCNIQSIMNCSTLCVGWSLSLSVFLRDFFQIFQQDSKYPSLHPRHQYIQHQVTRSLAIGPTPGLGPSQRCSGGNNFSRTCGKKPATQLRIWENVVIHTWKLLPVPQSSNKFGGCSASTHLKEVRRSRGRCRTAVCHVVVPSPMFCFQSRVGRCALENKTLQCCYPYSTNSPQQNQRNTHPDLLHHAAFQDSK